MAVTVPHGQLSGQSGVGWGLWSSRNFLEGALGGVGAQAV